MPERHRSHLALATAGVLALAIIAITCIAIWAPDDDRVELLAAGGLLSSVVLAAMRALWSSANALPIALAIIVGSQAVACGPAATQVHAQAGAALQDVARESRDVVRTWRTDHMRAAARAVYEADGPIEEAQAAAEQAAREAEPVVEGQRDFAMSVLAYIGASLLAAQHPHNPALSELAPVILDVLASWEHLRRLGEVAGIAWLAALPAAPTVLAPLLPTEATSR
jgi:hypothetical protein